jgi:hypothetical protein
MTTSLVLLPPAAADRMAATGSGWGHLNMTVSRNHSLAAVTGVSDGNRTMFPADLGLPIEHPLRVSDAVPLSAAWHRVEPERADRGVGVRYEWVIARGVGSGPITFIRPVHDV